MPADRSRDQHNHFQGITAERHDAASARPSTRIHPSLGARNRHDTAAGQVMSPVPVISQTARCKSGVNAADPHSSLQGK